MKANKTKHTTIAVEHHHTQDEHKQNKTKHTPQQLLDTTIHKKKKNKTKHTPQ
jgi:hypothetical protein